MTPLSPTNLTGFFLLALPRLGHTPSDEETPFAGSLIYVCEHNKDGAFGIVINRATNLTVPQLFEGAGLPATPQQFNNRWQGVPVFWGGPVRNDRGFILHQPLGQWQTTLTVNDNLGMTTSRDLLEAMSQGGGPEEALVSLGYAGWSAGQLEEELAQNAWLAIPGTNAASVLFHCAPEERAEQAMKQLGINLSSFSSDAGHA